MINTEDIFYNTMVKILYKSGELLKEGFGTNITIKDKDGSNNIVTDYDFKSEELIISSIKSAYPDHSFLAEESGRDINNSGFRWIIDPLDGTVNFANRIPVFCVSIALEIEGNLHCGGIFNPITNETFLSLKDHGCYFNNIKSAVSQKTTFESSLVATGFPYRMKEESRSIMEILARTIEKGVPLRRLGAAALDLAYTADGRFEGFWETGLNPWDVAAGILMVKESGGKVTDYKGNDYKIGVETIVAGNKQIVNSIVGLINEN